jgi:hypothetical protein
MVSYFPLPQRYSDPSLKELDVSVSAGMVALYPDTQYTGSSRLVRADA